MFIYFLVKIQIKYMDKIFEMKIFNEKATILSDIINYLKDLCNLSSDRKVIILNSCNEIISLSSNLTDLILLYPKKFKQLILTTDTLNLGQNFTYQSSTKSYKSDIESSPYFKQEKHSDIGIKTITEPSVLAQKLTEQKELSYTAKYENYNKYNDSNLTNNNSNNNPNNKLAGTIVANDSLYKNEYKNDYKYSSLNKYSKDTSINNQSSQQINQNLNEISDTKKVNPEFNYTYNNNYTSGVYTGYKEVGNVGNDYSSKYDSKYSNTNNTITNNVNKASSKFNDYNDYTNNYNDTNINPKDRLASTIEDKQFSSGVTQVSPIPNLEEKYDFPKSKSNMINTDNTNTITDSLRNNYLVDNYKSKVNTGIIEPTIEISGGRNNYKIDNYDNYEKSLGNEKFRYDSGNKEFGNIGNNVGNVNDKSPRDIRSYESKISSSSSEKRLFRSNFNKGNILLFPIFSFIYN